MQFLLEAVVLCNVGGVIGIALGFVLGNVFTFFTAFEATDPAGLGGVRRGFLQPDRRRVRHDPGAEGLPPEPDRGPALRVKRSAV
jgi:ABC-type antimicrobial peptide transport system permease subunit